MSEVELLTLKQQLTKLSEPERREVSAFIVRLGQETTEWKAETSRRLDEMASGKKTTLSELKDRVDHG